MIFSGSFCQHNDTSVGYFTKRIYSLLPECKRNKICSITSESIHIGLQNPIFHGFDHFFPHVRIVKIQISHILPVGSGRGNNISIGILGVPCLILYPWIVPGSMVCSPVQNYCHFAFVGFVGQFAQIFQITVFGTYFIKILDTVRRIY